MPPSRHHDRVSRIGEWDDDEGNATIRTAVLTAGPIFGLLRPDRGAPTLGSLGVGGTELQHVETEYGLSTRGPFAAVVTTYLDRVQGAIAISPEVPEERREEVWRDVMRQERQRELGRPVLERLDFVLGHYEDGPDLTPVSTGRLTMRVEDFDVAVDTWTVLEARTTRWPPGGNGSLDHPREWHIGIFEGEFRGRLVEVKVGIEGCPIRECTLAPVTDLGALAATI